MKSALLTLLFLGIGFTGGTMVSVSGAIRNTTGDTLVIDASLKDGSLKTYVLEAMQSAVEPERFDTIIQLDIEQIKPRGSRSRRTLKTFHYEGMKKQEKLGKHKEDLVLAQHGAYPLHVMSNP